MGRFYWFLLFLASAIATHAAYVLYYPGYNFDSKLEAAVGPDSRNKMLMLTPAQVARLFPAYATSDIVAMCRYDLTDGPMQIAAKLPRGYWTFSIFTVKGRQVYSLTDAQAGENSFTVDLLQAPDLIAQLKGALDEGGCGARRVRVGHPDHDQVGDVRAVHQRLDARQLREGLALVVAGVAGLEQADDLHRAHVARRRDHRDRVAHLEAQLPCQRAADDDAARVDVDRVEAAGERDGGGHDHRGRVRLGFGGAAGGRRDVDLAGAGGRADRRRSPARDK